jgi:mono/diheme cytochrome c family protein
VKAKVKRQKVKIGSAPRALGVRPSRLLFAFCLFTFAFFFSGCRMDMQDQPKYKTYRAGDRKYGVNGASVRPLVEGTVPRRGAGAAYRDSQDYLYTGKADAGQPGSGAQTGGTTGGVGAAVPSMPAGMSVNSLAGASELVRGNTAGGVPGAREAAATGGPDMFPINIDEETLRRGRERYQIYCTACHGMTGEGDGMIVRRGFRRPPSFYDDRLQDGVTPAAHFFDVITNGWGAMPDYSAQIAPEDRWKIIAYVRALQLSRRVKFEELSPEEQQKVRGGAQNPGSGHEGGSPQLQSPQTGGTSPQVEGNH